MHACMHARMRTLHSNFVGPYSRVIESVGEGVTDLKEGDHVLPTFMGQCDNCRHCKSTKSNLCENFGLDLVRYTMLGDGKSRFSIDGKEIGISCGSTFSEYTVLEQEYVVKVNPLAPLDKICVLSCGISTGMQSLTHYFLLENVSVFFALFYLVLEPHFTLMFY